MKKFILSFLGIMLALSVKAQVPNFGTPAGDRNLYGYSSVKYRANINNWETYSTLQYGITDYIAVGADLYTTDEDNYIGYTIRTGFKVSKWFKIGAQFTPSFSLLGNHDFSYMTYALYMNGDISGDGKFFWVTDTWLEQNRTELTSAKQWTYLGYTCTLGSKGNSITPLVGIIHDWKFESDIDLSFGAYYSHKNINLYAWTNDILTNHPRFVLAVEFKFGN